MSYPSCTSEKLPLLSSHRDERKGATKLMGLKNPSFYFSFYIFLYAMFLCSGAAIFSLLEMPMDLEARITFGNAIADFKTLNPNVSDHALETLIVEIVKAHKRGLSTVGNSTGEPNWSFGQSLFFTGTIVTTIGYGRVSPFSRSGKIFCMIYALIGIPLTLVLLSALVERLLVPVLWLLKWLHLKLGHMYKPFKIRLLHLIIICFPYGDIFFTIRHSTAGLVLYGALYNVVILKIFCLLIPGAIFYYLESEWEYLDSIYYCFVSLTTIGLGDFIPGEDYKQPYRPLYKILTIVYLFVGIAYTMVVLAIFYDIPQFNLGLLFTSSSDHASEKERLATSGQTYNAITALPTEDLVVVRSSSDILNEDRQ